MPAPTVRPQLSLERHPDVRLLRGNGQLYWNGGMRRAFGEAMAADYDYYLWMNDDTSSTTALSRCCSGPSASCASKVTGLSSWLGRPGTLTPESSPTVARSGSRDGGVWHGHSCSLAANRVPARR